MSRRYNAPSRNRGNTEVPARPVAATAGAAAVPASAPPPPAGGGGTELDESLMDVTEPVKDLIDERIEDLPDWMEYLVD